MSKEVGDIEKATAIVKKHKDNLPAMAIAIAQALHDERARCVAAVEDYWREEEAAAEESIARGAGLSSVGHSFKAAACDAIFAAIRGATGGDNALGEPRADYYTCPECGNQGYRSIYFENCCTNCANHRRGLGEPREEKQEKINDSEDYALLEGKWRFQRALAQDRLDIINTLKKQMEQMREALEKIKSGEEHPSDLIAAGALNE